MKHGRTELDVSVADEASSEATDQAAGRIAEWKAGRLTGRHEINPAARETKLETSQKYDAIYKVKHTTQGA